MSLSFIALVVSAGHSRMYCAFLGEDVAKVKGLMLRTIWTTRLFLSSQMASIGKKTKNMSMVWRFSLEEARSNAWPFFNGFEKRRPLASRNSVS